jgi:hypothetical protein
MQISLKRHELKLNSPNNCNNQTQFQISSKIKHDGQADSNTLAPRVQHEHYAQRARNK